ncbi:MAG: 2,3-bisphosphoglycerate-independent phosphoglycerate mutase [Deltaproteobacteria bacterium]|nr:2,3-bisphosphoglycerate-independent phosphoglycerate mutase [Nannocystaceae bacterium]
MIETLSAHPYRVAPRGPVVCVVMDGVGIGDGGVGDAVASARTPTLDRLRGLPSYRELQAHGRGVGMPSDADMGNSEVGHNALGAGRIFDQGAKLVAESIASGELFAGATWQGAIAFVRSSGQSLHFLGLLSDGNVHSHIDHLLAMLRRAASEGVATIRVHALLDGRDVPARSALGYLDTLEGVLAELRGHGCDAQVASGGGRMRITMDRYQAEWAMVARGWDVHVHGIGRTFPSARAAVETMYAELGVDDQNLDGFVIDQGQGPVGPIRDGAAVILFNFRGDRALEISRAFEQAELTAFARGPKPDVFFAGMMQYDGDEQVPARFLVAPPTIDRTMGELLAVAGRRQLAVSETQKFGHVTYFWNGNRTGKFDEVLERYLEVPSDVAPFEQRPWMQAAEITDALVAAITGEHFDFVRVNYANGDMVGHTGVIESTRLAVEAVDLCLGRVLEAVERLGGVLVVTADHGNADQMLDVQKDGSMRVRTSHSLNPVPFAIFDPREPGGGPRMRVDPPGARANLGYVAATCLELLGLAAPADYLPSLLAPRS